jgi:hypothetical protein
MRGVYNAGVNRISFRECNIYATQTGGTIGTTAAIGCETDVSGAIIECRTSTISGTGNDINQGATGSMIMLGMTDLVNRTANSKSFTLTTMTSNQTYSLGNADNVAITGTNYLAPGTIIKPSAGNIGDILNIAIPIAMNQVVLINSISVTPNNTTITTGATFAVTRIPANGNPGITYMSVFVPGSTTTTYFNREQTMRIGVGDTMNLSMTATIPENGLLFGDVTLY